MAGADEKTETEDVQEAYKVITKLISNRGVEARRIRPRLRDGFYLIRADKCPSGAYLPTVRGWRDATGPSEKNNKNHERRSKTARPAIRQVTINRNSRRREQ